jgi:signal transduction histidine kinase/CheY-like chemotaxis protein
VQTLKNLSDVISDGVLVFENSQKIAWASDRARHLISHFTVPAENIDLEKVFSANVIRAIQELLIADDGATRELMSPIWRSLVENDLPAELTLSTDTSGSQIVVVGILRRTRETAFARDFQARRQKLLELIGLMGIIAYKSSNQDEVLQVGLSEIGKCLGWDLGHAYILNEETDKLEPADIWYEKTPLKYEAFRQITKASLFAAGEGLPGLVWQTGDAVWIPDISQSDNFPRWHKVENLDLVAAVAVPVLAWGRVVAVLEFFVRTREEKDPRLLELMVQICSQIGHAHERNSAVKSANWEQRRFETFLDATSDWFWMMGPDLRFSEWDFKDHPATTEPPAGNLRWELATDEDLADVAKWRRHREDLEAYRPFRNFEYQFQNPDGERVWLSTTGIPLFDHDGNFEGYWGATSNISQQKTLQSQLLQARKMDAVGNLTGGVAHDFNNILSVVIWNLDMALEELDLDEISTEVIQRAQAAAGRGVNLTNRLLAFSRKQMLHPGVVNVSLALEEFTGLLDRTLGEEIVVRTELAANLWNVELDRSELENAVLNLAINARDAINARNDSTSQAEISLKTENVVLQPDGLAYFAISEATEFVHLSVTDNGAGMTEETRLQAFEPFFTTKISGLGTGLGLSTIYGFVKQSNGFIDVTSVVDVGTTIDIYLPRNMGEEIVNEADENPVPEVPRGQGERILVVEDDPDVRFSVTAILESLGYVVGSVESGQAGCDYLEAHEDVEGLLTDVMLGSGMSGRDLSRWVEDKFPHINVLHMSGYAENEIVHDGILEEGVRLLQKPFTKAQLAREIRTIFDEAS